MEALPLHPFPNPMSPSSHEPGHSRRSSDQDDAPSEVYDADQEDLEADEDETFAAGMAAKVYSAYVDSTGPSSAGA